MFKQYRINKLEQKIARLDSLINDWANVSQIGAPQNRQRLPGWAIEDLFEYKADRAVLQKKLYQLLG